MQHGATLAPLLSTGGGDAQLRIEDTEVVRIAIEQEEVARGEESRYDHLRHGFLLVAAGQSCREVAELFGENDTTVQHRVRQFEQGGLDALREGGLAGRPRTLEAKDWRRPQGDLCKTSRDVGLPTTLWDGPVLSEQLCRRYRVDLGVRRSQRLFRQMGVRLRKPRSQVAQSDLLKVAIVKNLQHLAARCADVELRSQHEYHCQQGGSRCCIWVPPAIKDAILQHVPIRKSVARFGAVSLDASQFVRATCPAFNAAPFWAFLRRVLCQQTPGRRMILAPDNSCYHYALLAAPLLRRNARRLWLLFLPRCSPQLAPIERLRKLTRCLATHNRYFAMPPGAYKDVNACFDQRRRANAVLRRLCRIREGAMLSF
jgi:transposase